MTAKTKGTSNEEASTEAATLEAKAEEVAPSCGAPHFLPALAHLTCMEPAPDPDLPPGTPGHEHRYQDGDAIYTWR